MLQELARRREEAIKEMRQAAKPYPITLASYCDIVITSAMWIYGTRRGWKAELAQKAAEEAEEVALRSPNYTDNG